VTPTLRCQAPTPWSKKSTTIDTRNSVLRSRLVQLCMGLQATFIPGPFPQCLASRTCMQISLLSPAKVIQRCVPLNPSTNLLKRHVFLVSDLFPDKGCLSRSVYLSSIHCSGKYRSLIFASVVVTDSICSCVEMCDRAASLEGRI